MDFWFGLLNFLASIWFVSKLTIEYVGENYVLDHEIYKDHVEAGVDRDFPAACSPQGKSWQGLVFPGPPHVAT